MLSLMLLWILAENKRLTANAPPAVWGFESTLAAALAAPGAELPFVNINGALTPLKPNLPMK